jgi:AcrR family transcriptional regulator
MARPRDRIQESSVPSTLPYAAKLGHRKEKGSVEDAVFAATEELLLTYPIADVTVAQILERAGVSRTTFYHYFTSKLTVVSAMLDNLQTELVDVMRPWFGRGERDPEAALRESLVAVAGVWAKHRPVMRASTENWHAEPELGERWVAMMDRFIVDIAAQIDRERAAGAAPPGADSRQIATTLVWAGERLMYIAGWGMMGHNLERDAVDGMVATWMGAVYGGFGGPR